MITIEKFAADNRVSVQQVKRRYKEIGGIIKAGRNKYIIPDGTRYPAKKSKRINSQEEKLYYVLNATVYYRYVDHLMLAIPQNSFLLLIEQLLKMNLIQENNSKNPYGANSYDATLDGSIFIRSCKGKKRQEISITIAGMVGRAIGEFIAATGKAE